MAKVSEIAPGVYRISIYVPEISLQFNHFLVNDDESLLFHTGSRRMFPELRESLASVIDPARLRWISYSHFEADECGALNDWLSIAPHARAVSGLVGVLVNLQDFAAREPRVLGDQDLLVTGKHRFRFISTPHLPHGWDAGVLFDEVDRTLFCSDLFHQSGDAEPVTSNDIMGRVRETLIDYQAGPLANYVPYTARTGRILRQLADLNPATLAIMHGSSYAGNCSQALRDLAVVFKEVLGADVEETSAAA